jgi:ribonuclease D
MIKKNNKNLFIIQNNKDLDTLILKYKNSKIFYLDTEFDRKTTYKAIVSFVVLFDGKTIGIIDCLEKKLNYIKILKFINKKKNTLVIHSCRQDIEILLNVCKKIICKIFDTQIAANFIGYSNPPSYKKLVFDFCKISLDKNLQNTDWLIRPLNKKKTEYLINDVIYLSKIFTKIKNQSAFKKNITKFNKILRNELNRIYNNEYSIIYKNKLGKDLYLNKNLKKIINYRNQIAKNKNIPKNWVLSDKNIINLIKNKNNKIKSDKLSLFHIKELTILIKKFRSIYLNK